jgi:hypothetical protein
VVPDAVPSATRRDRRAQTATGRSTADAHLLPALVGARSAKEHVPPFHSSFTANPLSLPNLFPVDLRDSFSRP